MPFPRQRCAGLSGIIRSVGSRQLAIIGISTVSTISLVPAQARPAAANHKPHPKTRPAASQNLPGAWGWTRGSQTFIRTRPSALTPPVGKVPRHTKLCVWGKFDGWYRVETTDHVFGWVFYDCINCPDDHRLQELSHYKAKIACQRSDQQTMFGSPSMLRHYYAVYHAPGALKGLQQAGIEVPELRQSFVATGQVRQRQVAARPVRGASQHQRSVSRAARQPVRNVGFSSPAKAPVKVAAAAPSSVASPSLQGSPVAVIFPETAPARPLAAAMPANDAAIAPPVKPHAAPRRHVARKQARHRHNHGATRIVPPLASPALAPISPGELMRARDEYLKERRQSLTGDVTPSRSSNAVPAPSQQATVRPSAFDETSSVALYLKPISYRPGSRTRASYDDRQTVPDFGPNSELLRQIDVTALWPAPNELTDKATSKPIVARQKARPVGRGGSPRDYARMAMAKRSQVFGQGMATQAMTYRGMPYIFGASSPRRGFDCSGLIFYLLRQRGYTPPRTASGYRSYGHAVPRNKLRQGDIVLFANTYKRGISHIGVYIGHDKFLHAANPGKGVRVDSLSTPYYSHKFYGARRLG